MLFQIKRDIHSKASKEKAKILSKFFKTGKGEYGEGDVFLGLTVPKSREIVKKYWKEITINEIQELLNSKIHEERLIGLLILVKKFEKNSEERKEIFNFYLKNTNRVNNWDLVDLSASNIVGRYILENGIKNPFLNGKLIDLANSDDIWEKRISIISTFYYIKNNRFAETKEIAKILLKDKHDLIHKAVGWMLREMGKRDEKVLKDFLKKYYKIMPRTMLRYSIEKFDEKTRQKYLNGEI